MNSSAVPEDPAACGDVDQHPGGPPVDRDGKIIGDIPWKFFDGRDDRDGCRRAGYRPCSDDGTMER